MSITSRLVDSFVGAEAGMNFEPASRLLVIGAVQSNDLQMNIGVASISEALHEDHKTRKAICSVTRVPDVVSEKSGFSAPDVVGRLIMNCPDKLQDLLAACQNACAEVDASFNEDSFSGAAVDSTSNPVIPFCLSPFHSA